MLTDMIINIQGKEPFRTTDTPAKRNFYKKHYGDKVRFEDPYEKLEEKYDPVIKPKIEVEVYKQQPKQNNATKISVEQPQKNVRSQRGRPPQKSDE